MRVFGRLLIALAVLLPVLVAVAGAAGGASGSDGTAVMKCGPWKGAMRATPGLTHTPSDQDVDAHGRVYGCNKAGGGGTYKARLHATNATCGHFSLSGTGQFDWANGKRSTANLVFQQQPSEPYKYLVSGQITSGLFDTLVLRSFLRFSFTFTGTGPACTATNPLTKIDFTNTHSLQLFRPRVPTTTVPRRPTTTTTDPPGTTVPRNATNVPNTTPITTQASTTTTTATPVTQEATTVSQSDSGGGSLASTGSGGAGALVGLEAVIIGGALACFGEDRRRRAARLATLRRGPRRWLHITMPPDVR